MIFSNLLKRDIRHLKKIVWCHKFYPHIFFFHTMWFASCECLMMIIGIHFNVGEWKILTYSVETIKVYNVQCWYYGWLYWGNDDLISLISFMDPSEVGLVEILIDYNRANCNNVRKLSGKCQGISTGVVRGNPEWYIAIHPCCVGMNCRSWLYPACWCHHVKISYNTDSDQIFCASYWLPYWPV